MLPENISKQKTDDKDVRKNTTPTAADLPLNNNELLSSSSSSPSCESGVSSKSSVSSESGNSSSDEL